MLGMNIFLDELENEATKTISDSITNNVKQKIMQIDGLNVTDEIEQKIQEIVEDSLSEKTIKLDIKNVNSKLNLPFYITFIDNLFELLKTTSKADITVLVALAKMASYKNVYNVSQKKIIEMTGLTKSTVSKSFANLKEKSYIIEDENGFGYINPYIFFKGNTKDILKAFDSEQLGLFCNNGAIESPFNLKQ